MFKRPLNFVIHYHNTRPSERFLLKVKKRKKKATQVHALARIQNFVIVMNREGHALMLLWKMYLAWRIMLEKILHRYVSRTKKISTTWGKSLTQTKSPIHHHPTPPKKVNLYTESVFLLASVMVKINSVKSWWGKGLHLPSAGLLVQTRKNSKKQKRKNSRFSCLRQSSSSTVCFF